MVGSSPPRRCLVGCATIAVLSLLIQSKILTSHKVGSASMRHHQANLPPYLHIDKPAQRPKVLPIFNDTTLLAGEPNIFIGLDYIWTDTNSNDQYKATMSTDNSESDPRLTPIATQALENRIHELQRDNEIGNQSESTDPETRSWYLDNPAAIAFHPRVGLVFSDTSNNRLMRINPDGVLEKWAGHLSVKAFNQRVINSTDILPPPSYTDTDEKIQALRDDYEKLTLKEKRQELKRQDYNPDKPYLFPENGKLKTNRPRGRPGSIARSMLGAEHHPEHNIMDVKGVEIPSISSEEEKGESIATTEEDIFNSEDTQQFSEINDSEAGKKKDTNSLKNTNKATVNITEDTFKAKLYNKINTDAFSESSVKSAGTMSDAEVVNRTRKVRKTMDVDSLKEQLSQSHLPKYYIPNSGDSRDFESLPESEQDEDEEESVSKLRGPRLPFEEMLRENMRRKEPGTRPSTPSKRILNNATRKQAVHPCPNVIDGPLETSNFDNPYGLAFDSHGNLYIADTNHHKIRKISYGSNVTETIAGNTDNPVYGLWSAGGYIDGYGTLTKFNNPRAIAVYPNDKELLIADEANDVIRKISLDKMEVSTFVGTRRKAGNEDGFGRDAKLYCPVAVAIDSNSNAYFSCKPHDHRVQKIEPNGNVTHFAGSVSQYLGYADGDATTCRFGRILGLAVDRNDNVYISDAFDNRIRMATPDGEVSTIAGPVFKKKRRYLDKPGELDPPLGDPGTSDGLAREASFNYPTGIAVDHVGNVYICDSGNDRVRRLNRIHPLGPLPLSHAALDDSSLARDDMLQSFD